MSLTHKLFALAFLCAILFAAAIPSFASAQETDELESTDASDASKPVETEANEYEEEVVEEVVEAEPQMYVMPAVDVTTSVKFLGVSDNKFVAGDEVVALVGMQNSGDKTYNVSFVGAHLHSPYDVNFYVQNFTVRWTSNLLPPKSEVTVEYRFRPDERLDPLDYHLSGWLIYNDTATVPIIYRSLFFNQTVEILEKRSEWTVQSAFTTLLTLTGVCIAGYVFVQQSGVNLLAKKSKKRTAEAGAPAAQWETKIYKPASTAKPVGSKNKKQ